MIQRLLAKNAADRPSSAQDVIQALSKIDPKLQTIPLPPRRQPKKRVLVALTLVGLIVLLAAIVIRIRSKDGRETTIEVPEGSKVTIEQDGKVAVDLSRDRQGAVVPPLTEGTEPLGTFALVRRPARLKGVRSWTIETRSLRGSSSCAMRPDGRQLAVGGFDGVIRIYDPSTGHLQHALFGQQKSHHHFSLAWSPDGKRLTARSDKNNTLHIWNAATGQILRTIQSPGNYGGLVAWSPNGKLLAVGSDTAVTLWDPDSGTQVPFEVLARNVRGLAWSPDSKMLSAIGAAPKLVWLWEIPSGKLLRKFEVCKGDYPTLAWSRDGTILVSEGAGSTKELRIWDAYSGKLLRTLELQGRITTAAYSPDGKTLAVGGHDGYALAQLFDTGTWKPLCQLWPGSQDHISSIAWSPDSTTLVTACYQRHVSIFDVKTGKEVRRIEAHPHFGSVAWSADDKKIVLALGWEGFRIWDVDSGTQARRIEGYANSSSWSPSGKSLAGIRENGFVEQYDGESGQRLRSWEAPVLSYVPPAWSADGKYIATATKDKTVQVWAAASGRLVHTLKGHAANLNAIAFSPDGKRIASGCEGDKMVWLWDASSGKHLHSFDAGQCFRLAWSPDGQNLASGAMENVRTWNMETKELQTRCSGLLLGWSTDSKTVLTWEVNGRVRSWDRLTGELRSEVAFPYLGWLSWLSPMGQFIANYQGGALRIGAVSRGTFQLALVPLRNGQWLAVRPDGHYRGSPGVEKEIVYIVQTDAGQEVLAPDEFAKRYGWKNDPQRVRLPRR